MWLAVLLTYHSPSYQDQSRQQLQRPEKMRPSFSAATFGASAGDKVHVSLSQLELPGLGGIRHLLQIGFDFTLLCSKSFLMTINVALDLKGFNFCYGLLISPHHTKENFIGPGPLWCLWYTARDNLRRVWSLQTQTPTAELCNTCNTHSTLVSIEVASATKQWGGELSVTTT